MSTDIKLYTGEEEVVFSEKQLTLLDKPLDQRLVSKRKGGFGRMLSYIEGHDAIDQANRIFGYGNWCYHPVSVEQVVLLDPLSGEAVGIEYKAQVELTVRGAIGPIVDIGSQPVATWNVEDQIMQRRLKAANGGKVNEAEFTLIEKREARAVIVEAHEQAKKGSVTDALKRALRAFGNQFGNGLYGDGHVDLSEPGTTTVVEARPRQLPPASNGHQEPLPIDNMKQLATRCRIRAVRLGYKTIAQYETLCQEVIHKNEPETLVDINALNVDMMAREQKSA
jgi:Rad52/22 family double-strand break repair protein